MDKNKYANTVISTRVRLARNINNLPFPRRLQGQEEIYSVLLKGVKESCDALYKNQYRFYQMDKIDDADSLSLVERHLISKNLQNSQYGAAFITEGEDISIMVNEEDHLRIQSIVKGFNLETAFNKAAEIDKELKNHLDIAYDEKLGYLTACPTNLGSAMRASVMMFLPALSMTNMIETVILRYQDEGITIRGIYGEGSKAEGYIYQISNQAAISLSEKEILKRVGNAVENLINAEEIARNNLKAARGIDLQNDIMISYGILKYCCKISSQEMMQDLALVKLGVNLGYLKLDMNKLNDMLVLSQPGMLCYISKQKLDARGRDIERAKFIKNYLE